MSRQIFFFLRVSPFNKFLLLALLEYFQTLKYFLNIFGVTFKKSLWEEPSWTLYLLFVKLTIRNKLHRLTWDKGSLKLFELNLVPALNWLGKPRVAHHFWDWLGSVSSALVQQFLKQVLQVLVLYHAQIWILSQDQFDEVHLPVRGEGRGPYHKFVQETPESPNVGLLIKHVFSEVLWREVGQGSEDNVLSPWLVLLLLIPLHLLDFLRQVGVSLLDEGPISFGCKQGEPKVNQLGVPIRINHDVFRLQVSVDYPCVM